MNFLKQVMIVRLKKKTTGKSFANFFLKAIRDTFCPIYGLKLREGRSEK